MARLEREAIIEETLQVFYSFLVEKGYLFQYLQYMKQPLKEYVEQQFDKFYIRGGTKTTDIISTANFGHYWLLSGELLGEELFETIEEDWLKYFNNYLYQKILGIDTLNLKDY